MDKKKVKLKKGDILSFQLPTGLYGFARVVGRLDLGDIIEVYDYFSENQNDYEKAILASPFFPQPVVLDGYGIFWKRKWDNWSLLKRDDKFKYEEEDAANVKFKYGVPGLFKLIDLNGKSYTDISQDEAEKYEYYSPYTNQAILRRVNFLLDKKKSEGN